MIPGITASGRKPWTPYDLFEVGVEMAWYNPANLASMWQDTAATIPVTADGQLVARIDDSYGVGPYLANADIAQQPVYRTDGVKHWLEFDGVDDYLNSSIAGWTPLTVSSAITQCTAANRVSETGASAHVASNFASNRAEGYLTYYPASSTAPFFCVIRKDDTNYNISTAGMAVDTTPRVGTLRWDGSNTERRLLYNDITKTGAATPAGTVDSSLVGVYSLGKSASANSNYLNGNCWGALVFGKALTNDEMDKLQEFMRIISGSL